MNIFMLKVGFPTSSSIASQRCNGIVYQERRPMLNRSWEQSCAGSPAKVLGTAYVHSGSSLTSRRQSITLWSGKLVCIENTSPCSCWALDATRFRRGHLSRRHCCQVARLAYRFVIVLVVWAAGIIRQKLMTSNGGLVTFAPRHLLKYRESTLLILDAGTRASETLVVFPCQQYGLQDMVLLDVKRAR